MQLVRTEHRRYALREPATGEYDYGGLYLHRVPAEMAKQWKDRKTLRAHISYVGARKPSSGRFGMHAVCYGLLELWDMPIAGLDRIMAFPKERRDLAFAALELEAEMRHIKEGVRRMPELERELNAAKARLAALGGP